MVNTTFDELRDIGSCNSGNNGIVYRVDEDTMYKIYKDRVKNIMDHYMDNPMLTTFKGHYKRLIKRGKNIKYTDLMRDMIYINGKFYGVVIKPYDGPTLWDLKRMNMDYKAQISREVIRNVLELTRNRIYPTDLKPSNVMLYNGMVKLVDLDDLRTHAFFYHSPLFKLFTVNSLGRSIEEYFREYDNPAITNAKVFHRIGRRTARYIPTVRKINKYITKKLEYHNYLFVDINTNIEELKEFIEHNDMRVVYIFDKAEDARNYALDVLKYYKSLGVKIYDFCLRDQIEDYKTREQITQAYLDTGKTLKRLYK